MTERTPEPKDNQGPAISSTPHPGRPSEISPGIYEAKHFAGPLGGPLLLFLKIVHETAFGETRWRNGAWITRAEISRETGRPWYTVRRWIAELEAGGYVLVRRGQNGFRITLAKRIWYRHGKPVVALPKHHATRTDSVPPRTDSVPPRTESVPLRRRKPHLARVP